MNAIAQLRPFVDENEPGLLRAALDASLVSFAVIEKGKVLYRNPAFAEAVASEDFIEIGMSGGSHEVSRKLASTVFQFEGRDIWVVSSTSSADEAPPRVGELMVAGIAHDFNNLLTGLRLYCDLLLRDLPSDSKAHGYGIKIRKTTDASKALVEQLLAVARMVTIPADALSWNEIISATQSFLMLLCGNRIELFNELSPRLHPVSLDPVSARRILLNLVLNARDAMPDGGSARLSTRNMGEWVELSVTDDGRGMDAATGSRIFEPFYTTKSAGAGFGLGLHTVRALVEKNGGSLSIESALGAGTQVTVRLPQTLETKPQPLTKMAAPENNASLNFSPGSGFKPQKNMAGAQNKKRKSRKSDSKHKGKL